MKGDITGDISKRFYTSTDEGRFVAETVAQLREHLSLLPDTLALRKGGVALIVYNARGAFDGPHLAFEYAEDF